MKTIVRMKFGSHLYGTDTSQSDLDFKEVFIPDGKSILLQRITNTYQSQRVKAKGEKNFAGEVDTEQHSLQRFFRLLTEGNPMALDMLFATNNVIETATPIWSEIKINSFRLLTRKSVEFVHYCRQQANKYGIKGSRVRAMLDARNLFQSIADRAGGKTKLRDHAAEIEAFVIGRDHTAVVELPIDPLRRPGETLKHFECCGRKIPWTVIVDYAVDVYGKVYAEYGHRAKAAEKAEGIDWKALSHAVRVGHEALELMRTGHITFPLPNREHILKIKKAELPYAVVAEEIESLLSEVEEAEKTSTLPDEVDQEWIDYFVTKHHLNAVMNWLKEDSL